jgi:chromosomal replication initiation ATPase DnaA
MDHQVTEVTRSGGGIGGPLRGKQQKLTSTQRRRRALKRVLQAVEAVFTVDKDELQSATRGRWEIAFARPTAMYLARVSLGMTLSQAGGLFYRDRTTAAHACRLLEDLRDDPRFDALLSVMEEFVLRPDAGTRSGSQ